MKNRKLLLTLVALGATLGAASVAAAQDYVLYENNQTVGAAGLTTVSGGDADLKSFGLFNVGTNKIYLDVSFWQQVYLEGSTIKIQVYTFDSNNPYSTTLLYPTSTEQYLQGVEIPVPSGKNCTIHMRASCNQFPPTMFHPATVTYNHIFRLYQKFTP